MKSPRPTLLLVILITLPALAAGTAAASGPPIQNADLFLDECPSPEMTVRLLEDFKIRHNGRGTAVRTCAGRTSAVPLARFDDELIVLQSLRTIFELGAPGDVEIPWTDGLSLYDWLKARIDGINISDTAEKPYCCETFANKLYIVVPKKDPAARERDRRFEGIAANVAAYVHEARHVDGFRHATCCEGCDESFADGDLSPWGAQWWLTGAFASGRLGTGIACLPAERRQAIADSLLVACNAARERFCGSKPPEAWAARFPGGQCGDGNADGTVTSADILMLINHVYAMGPLGRPMDANRDLATDHMDILAIINFLYAGGPDPR